MNRQVKKALTESNLPVTGWAVMTTIALLMPGSLVPAGPVSLVNEILALTIHLILFAGLAYLTIMRFACRTRWAMFGAVLALGVLLEWSQYAIPGRSVQGLDLLANGTGATLGLAWARRSLYTSHPIGAADEGH